MKFSTSPHTPSYKSADTLHLCSCAAVGHSSWSWSGSHAPAQSVPSPRCGRPAVPHLQAFLCTFARAPRLATALGLGRGVMPLRSQCLLLGVAALRCHICKPFFRVFGSLGQPWSAPHHRLAAIDAAGIASQTSGTCASTVGRNLVYSHV